LVPDARITVESALSLRNVSIDRLKFRALFLASNKEQPRQQRLSLSTGSDIATSMEPPLVIANQAISVLIADDHPGVREGLAAIFKSQKDIKVIAEATNGEEACDLCKQLSPDVLLLDLRMPKKDGLQTITELIGRGATRPGIIVITTYENEEDIRRALKAGAKGFLVKGTAPPQIREAVRKVAVGESLLR
jgi:CheY-like chemotaxis protein